MGAAAFQTTCRSWSDATKSIDNNWNCPYFPRVRTTITLEGHIFGAGERRRKALKYRSFSQYVEFLIDKDVRERPKHIQVREEPPEFSKVASTRKKGGGKTNDNDEPQPVQNAA